MGRDRARQPSGKDGGGEREAEAEPGNQRWEQARLAKLVERKQLRSRLVEKVTSEVETTTLLALTILDGMELNDEAAELDPKLAETVGQKVCDKISDEVFEGLKVAFQLGEEVGGEAVLGHVKGALEHQSEKKGKLGAIQIKKAVKRSILEASKKYSEGARARVEKIPTEKIGEIGRILGAFEEFAGDPGDSDETGSLKAGMENQFLERLGFPQTGPARAHDVAVHAYQILRTELRAAKPVAEQADELTHVDQLPGEAERKASGAEQDLGPETKKDVERDQLQRRRTAAATS